MCNYPCAVRENGDKKEFIKHKDIYQILDYVIKSSQYKIVKCNNCFGCKLSYAYEWAIRNQWETERFPDTNYFLTLTYSDQHLPFNIKNKSPQPTLVRQDLRDFIKKLRNKFDRKRDSHIRFFASGEYGSLRGRPHYHVNVFNLPLEDLKSLGYDKRNIESFMSKTIDELWGKSDIPVLIMKANRQTANYIARYTLKKSLNPFKGDEFREGEFVTMSRGIGSNKFDKIYWVNDKAFYTKDNKSIECKIPKYFDRKYDELGEEEHWRLEELKAQRARKSKKILYDKMKASEAGYSYALFGEQVESERKAKLISKELDEQ